MTEGLGIINKKNFIHTSHFAKYILFIVVTRKIKPLSYGKFPMTSEKKIKKISTIVDTNTDYLF